MKFIDVDIDLHDCNKIGLRISGGADSAILLQLLCETIIAENPKAYIQPLTINLDIKPWNPYYVHQVLDYTKEKYPDIDIKPLIEVPCTEKTYTSTQAWIESCDEYKGLFEIVFGGVTANPLKSDIDDWGIDGKGMSIWEHRDKNRDQDVVKEIFTQHDIKRNYIKSCFPFANIDKKKIAELYDLLKVRQTLFPLTRSCEAISEDCEQFTIQCGKCWWCKERIYGFGSLE